MSILVVGSVAFDTIATPSGRVKDILGGAATYFALAASYFTDVRVVAVVGDDFGAEHEAVLTKNAEHAAKVVKAAVGAVPKARSCKCGSAVAHAILTDPAKIPAETKEKLKLILGKYL